MFIPNGKVDPTSDRFTCAEEKYTWACHFSVCHSQHGTEKIQKLQIGNKIWLKSGEVGHIVNTESPLGFIVLRDDGPVTIHFSSARAGACKQKIVPMKCQTNYRYLSLKHLKSDSK